MSDHTKGNWEWREYAAPKSHFFVMLKGTMPALHIAEMNSNKIPLDETVANAERIVTCVNEHDNLTAQRDALLAACKKMHAAIHLGIQVEYESQTEIEARAAIALCKP